MMPSFRYKAVSNTGDVVEGVLEAATQAAVLEHLQDLGHMPLRAEEASAGGSLDLLRRDLFPGRRLSRKRLVMITRELATLLGAGLPLDRALELLITLSGQTGHRDLMTQVLDAVRGGTSLGDALAEQSGAFPALYVGMVRAGEAGGALEAVLARLAEYLEQSDALADSVRSALIYPVVLLAMTAATIAVLMTMVVPEFKTLFDDAGESLPLGARTIIGVSDFAAEYWWAACGIVGASAWLLHRRLGDPAFRYRWDRLILGLPLFGDLTRKLNAARLTRTLGTLLENGVSLLNALTIVRGVAGNAVLSSAVETVIGKLREGNGLAEPLAETGAFPDLSAHLIKVGEETGELEAMLARTADIYDREVRTTIDRLVALLLPALTIGLGLVIAAIIGSVITAFLSLNELAL